MVKEIPDANLKLPEETVFMLKDLNHRLFRNGFNNIKILNTIAITELTRVSKGMTPDQFYSFIIMKVAKLQKKGIIKENARSIGKKK